MVHSNVAAELANIDRQFPMMPNPKVTNLSLHYIGKEIMHWFMTSNLCFAARRLQLGKSRLSSRRWSQHCPWPSGYNFMICTSIVAKFKQIFPVEVSDHQTVCMCKVMLLYLTFLVISCRDVCLKVLQFNRYVKLGSAFSNL